MNLADGHANVMTAPGDWISGDPRLGPFELPSAGDLGQFGPNPTTLPLEQLSSNAAVSPTDNVSRTGAEAHADYPRPDNGVLRTTGYNHHRGGTRGRTVGRRRWREVDPMKVSWIVGRCVAVTMAVGVLALAGCSGDGGSSGSGDSYDSPITNEDVPKMDIKNLPDIDATRAQMLDLIERVRAEVSRLVPASAPWTWRHKDDWGGCEQDGLRGVQLYLAKLTSPHSFTDEEWAVVLPAVERLAAEAGLTNGSAMRNSTGAHDVSITSDDGRELRFGSIEASLITGTIACRLSAGGNGAP